MDPPDVDPVQQIPRVIGEVAQLLGQMGFGVEGVGDGEEDLLADLLGFGAWSLGSSRWHGGLPVLVQDRRIRGGHLM
jgi:hypothetical protein